MGQVTIYYDDETSSGEFWCYVWGTNRRGGQSWSKKQYTCSGTHGCPDPTTTFVGHGQLTWFASSPAIYIVENVGVSCSIPPKERGKNAASWLKAFSLMGELY
jgi:hypothetical protein